jgi:hypothetical protein
MCIRIERVEGAELPSYFRSRGNLSAFKVIDHDGAEMYFESEIDAERWKALLQFGDKITYPE